MEINRKKVMFFGEKAVGSAPSLTAGQLLSKMGMDVEFCQLPNNTVDCLRLFKKFDYAINISYGVPSDWVIKQAALATIIGTPVLRWWVGSDVWYILNNSDFAFKAKSFDRCVSANISAAKHLKDELSQVDIQSEVIVKPLANVPKFVESWTEERATKVLIYLPEKREEFYGAKILDEIVPKNPNITFVLLCNSGKRYSAYHNVIAYEWVDDLTHLYRESGCLLRFTKHDGFPRMISEALASGMYVMYSWPLDGCIYVKDKEDVDSFLKKIMKFKESNKNGPLFIEKNLNFDLFKEQMEFILRSIEKISIFKKASMFILLLKMFFSRY